MYNMHTCGLPSINLFHSQSLAQPKSSLRLADDLQVLVKKESFQDLYLELKERHRHLDSRASKPGRNKIEDVKRHVWKVSQHPTRNSQCPSDPFIASSGKLCCHYIHSSLPPRSISSFTRA